MLNRQGPAVGQVNFEWLERPGSVQLPQLFDGHYEMVSKSRALEQAAVTSRLDPF
jgi:hypothetical protein